MKITLLFFGRPREVFNSDREVVDIPSEIASLADLLGWLRARGEKWAVELTDGRIRYAINQEVATLATPLKEGDEIALFSPISGG
jgi:molybdopterin synthase sulfur carrier subunit